jgi:hypothetical protein
MDLRRLPLARVGLAVALLAWAFLPAPRGAPVTPPPEGAEAPTWVVDIRDTPEGRLLLGRELLVPDKPLKGQATPPCPDGYAALGGGCWVKTDRSPPCPVTMWRSGTGCYLPLLAKAPLPSSMGR